MSGIINTLKTKSQDGIEQNLFPKTLMEAVVDSKTNQTLDVVLENISAGTQSGSAYVDLAEGGQESPGVIRTIKTKDEEDVEHSIFPKTVLEAVVNPETNQTLDKIVSDINEKVSNPIAYTIGRSQDLSAIVLTDTNGGTSQVDISDKVDLQTFNSHVNSASRNPHGVTADDVGLGDVNNTSDMDKPISTAVQEALNLKATEVSLSGHTSDSDNPHNVTKAQVGLADVDNTSDENKPVSTAQQSAIDAAETNAKGYTDTKIAELVNGAPTTLDTLKEIADAMAESGDVVAALQESIGSKANASDLTAHVNANDIHVSSTAKATWDSAAANSHTHSNKSVLDNTTASYTTEEKNKLSGIAAGANAYTHPGYTAVTNGLYKVTVDELGHVSGAAAVTKSDITALGIPAQDTTYSDATTSAAGLMSASDKTKLNNTPTFTLNGTTLIITTS